MQGDRKVRHLRRKRKPGNIKWLIKILTLILILFTAYFFIHSSFFSVASIQVIGAKQVKEADIIALSGLTKGENIFKIDKAEAEKKISTNSMVAGVQIDKQLPRRVKIIIQERIPVALVPVTGGLMQIDIDGFVLRKDSVLSQDALPIITGLDFSDTLAVGKKLESEKLVMGLKMIAQMDTTAKKEIAEIDVFDPQKLRAFTVQGAEVRLGNGDSFQEKFSKFLQVLDEEQKLDRLEDIEYIDVSFSGRPVVFYRK
ncbi:MAG: FtsQ-type POTRA domain-containing protein [Dehalobacterium sp.]